MISALSFLPVFFVFCLVQVHITLGLMSNLIESGPEPFPNKKVVLNGFRIPPISGILTQRTWSSMWRIISMTTEQVHEDN